MDRPTRSLESALASRYRLEAPLGAGGMGTVYAAYDLRHERRVAVKVLRPELATAIGADRFLREIQLVARLHHPHILPLYDSGDADGYLYFVMPQIEGESLRQRLDRDRRLPVAEAVRILRDVVDGLGAAHRAGVVHRDIKPDNILLEGRHALLADFGLAKRMLATSSGALTSAGLAIGTPRYMAPEQAAGSSVADERTDLYALGVVAYEMLAGVPPVDGPTAEQIMARQVTATPVPLGEQVPEVPAALAEIVMRCLAKDPAQRPQSADEVLGVLEGLATPSGARTPTLARRRPIAEIRRWWLWGAVATGAIALAAGAATRSRPPAMIRMPTQTQLTFSGRVQAASPSPDGQMLAVLSATDSGVQLTVKELSSDAETPLLHRPALNAVRWSPDGKHILFWADTAMYRVSRFGGEVQDLGPYGGVARDNHRLIKVSWTGPAIGYFDPRSGSACEVNLVAPGRKVLRSYNEHPAGGQFAVVLTSAEGDDSAIYLVTVDSTRCRSGSIDTVSNPVPLLQLPQIWTVRWGQGNASLYFLEFSGELGRLWRLTLDRRGNPAEEQLLAGGLEAGNIRFEVVQGTGAIVYVRGSAAANLHRLSFDRGGLVTRPITTGTAGHWFPRWDRSGTRIAFLKHVQGRSDLYILDDSSGRQTRATYLDSVEGPPAWSPDGRSLATLVRKNARRMLVTVVVGDAASSRSYDVATGTDPSVVWVSESMLAYVAEDGTLATFDLKSGVQRLRVGDSSMVGTPVAASPDGKHVLVSGFGSGAGIHLIDAVTGVGRRVLGPEFIPLGWAANGDEVLALHVTSRALVSSSYDGKVTRLGAFPSYGPLELWHTTANQEHVVVVSDGAGTRSDAWMLTDLEGPQVLIPRGTDSNPP